MSVSAPIHQKLSDISSLISKLLRKNIGRGPESCYVTANHHFLVIYIRGFLSPMEAILLEHGSLDHLKFSRNLVMESVLGNLQGILEHEFNQDVEDFYHAWNFEKNTGMITVVFEKNIAPIEEKTTASFTECDSLILEIERLSALVQKKPERTDAYLITPKLFLIKRTGILIPIEKALIAKGFQQILLNTLDEMETSCYELQGRFTDIFKQPIADIFVDWNLKKDTSVTCIMLR